MTRIKRTLALALVATATVAAPLVASNAAAAAVAAPLAASDTATAAEAAPLAASEVTAAHACGYNYDEYYRHCGDTHVIIRAENFWGTDYYLCVGPGDTYLGYLSDWRIIYAVYIGHLC